MPELYDWYLKVSIFSNSGVSPKPRGRGGGATNRHLVVLKGVSLSKGGLIRIKCQRPNLLYSSFSKASLRYPTKLSLILLTTIFPTASSPMPPLFIFI